MSDQDRFEYEVQRLMDDPTVQLELAMRDVEIALANLRDLLTKHCGHLQSQTARIDSVETWDNLPF